MKSGVPNAIARIVQLLIALAVAGCGGGDTSVDAPAYWIWAGITPAEAPPGAELIVYQGHFLRAEGQWGFQHRGIYPSPVEQSHIQVVLRMHELPPPEYIADVVLQYMADWRRHSVAVTGVQLDFDSPSARLQRYVDFLRAVRRELPAHLTYSITGLATWLLDADASTLKALHDSVDHVVYQLYAGRELHDDPQPYLDFLSRNPHPFKIGLLSHRKAINGIDNVYPNPAFRGIVYFIQR